MNRPQKPHDKTLEVLKNQLAMFLEQMSECDKELQLVIDKKIDVAIKIRVTTQSIEMIENPSPSVARGPDKPQLTQEYIREYMKHTKLWKQKPVQTKEIIDSLYRNATKEEKSKAIKILSVVFNNLEKNGEITVHRKPGVKGNFYVWAGDV